MAIDDSTLPRDIIQGRYTTPIWNAGTNGTGSSHCDMQADGNQTSLQINAGPGCSGLVEAATQDQGAGTTSHTVQVQGNGVPGIVGDNGIVPGATYWYEVVTHTATGEAVDDNGGKCYNVTVPGS